MKLKKLGKPTLLKQEKKKEKRKPAVPPPTPRSSPSPMVKDADRVKFTVLIPHALMFKVREQARERGLSLNGYINIAIHEYAYPAPPFQQNLTVNTLSDPRAMRHATELHYSKAQLLRKRFEQEHLGGYTDTIDQEEGKPLHIAASWEDVARYDDALADPKNEGKSYVEIGKSIGLSPTVSLACDTACVSGAYEIYADKLARVEAAEAKEQEELHA